MRWKLPSSGSNNPYTCCWCLHVKAGTLLLGIYSLLSQIAGFVLICYIFAHPDVVPQWMSSFEVSRFGMPQKGTTVCDLANIRQKRELSVNISAVTNGLVIPEIPGLSDPANSESGKKDTSDDADDGVMLPQLGDLMLRGQMLAGLNEKDSPGRDSAGVQLTDILSKSNDKPSDYSSDEDDGNDDDRELIIPIGIRMQGNPFVDDEFDPYRQPGFVDMNSDDRFFLFVMMVCCIASSAFLIIGVVKGRPGHMTPYMGLQAFDFCATVLLVFATFSYLPYLKNWLLSLPDSFPWKCEMLAMKSDRLMLTVVLTSVWVLVVKAYLMGVVWSCYKYLKQNDSTAGRRRSADVDMEYSPEDSEMLLPPKYEDIANTPAMETEAPPPPPYIAG